MDEISKKILNSIGIFFNDLNELNGQFIPREQLISDLKYEELKNLIPELKKHYSSSFMTSLQKNANIHQKWPLLNLVRQILNKFEFKMDPIRKSDGYTLDGIKKYKRFFKIEKKKNKNNIQNEIDDDITSNIDNNIIQTSESINNIKKIDLKLNNEALNNFEFNNDV